MCLECWISLTLVITWLCHVFLADVSQINCPDVILIWRLKLRRNFAYRKIRISVDDITCHLQLSIPETLTGSRVNGPHNPLRWMVLLLSGFVSPLLLALFKDRAGFPRSNGGRTLHSYLTPLTSISPPAELVVHVTSPYMTAAKPLHQSFGISNVETCMSSGFVIPRIPMRSLHTSSPG